MVDHEEFARWRTQAGRGLESARVQSAAGLHDWACFAAEQAAKLAVKALLHGFGQAPWGHDLVKLGEAARGVLGDEWPPAADERMSRLSRHYIPSRYPDAQSVREPRRALRREGLRASHRGRDPDPRRRGLGLGKRDTA